MDTRIENTRPRIPWQTLLVAAILLGFLCRMLLVLFPGWEERWKFTYNLACAALIGPVLGMTDIRRQWGMRLLLIAYAWIVVTCLLHFSAYHDPELLMTYLLMAAVSMGLLYPAVPVLGERRGRGLFRAAAVLYVAGITALSVTVLYAAFRGVYLPSPGGAEALGAGVFVPPAGSTGEFIEAIDRRINMFCNPIEGGLYCAISLVLALLLWQDAKRKLTRAALLLAAVILFAMLAISDARTPSWALCAVAGGAAYLAVQMRFPQKRAFMRFCVAVAAAAVAAAACFAMLRLLAGLLNPLIPNLNALRAADTDAGNLSGRTEVWKAAVQMLKENPDVLLTGAGPMRGMPLVQRYFTFDETVLAHPHSIVLSILITLGIPGLILFGAFIAYVAFHAVRLFFAGGRAAFSERAIPLLLAFCLIVDLIETFLSFSGVGDHSNPWFFLASGYVVYLSKARLSAGVTAHA